LLQEIIQNASAQQQLSAALGIGAPEPAGAKEGSDGQ
jgi:hypothetical protein